VGFDFMRSLISGYSELVDHLVGNIELCIILTVSPFLKVIVRSRDLGKG